MALRTIVVAIDGASPLQVVLRDPVVKLRIVELGDLDEEAQQCELQQQELRERREGFAFGDVLWRVSAFRRGPETFQLVLVLHHAIVDGWSFATLLAELWTEYQRPGSVPDQVSGPSYGVYVALERAAARSEAAAARWRSLLENAVFSGFPRDLSPELVLTPGEVAVKRFHLHALPAETTSLAQALARRLAVPNKSVFLAAWFKWLSLVSGRDDVVSGVVTHGRPELAAAEEQVGCFLNCVPLRMRLAPGSWQALILESAGLEGRVLPDRRFPLAEIERITGQSPLYRAGFNFVQFHVLGGARGEFEPLESREGNPDAAVEEPLWIEVSVVSDTEATLRVEYSPSVLSLRDAQAFAVGYAEVLSVLARSPQEEHQRWCPAWVGP
ncbi:MAG: condensation domain-containing protein [Hyphomicrobiaceae bacterium]